VQLKTSLTHFFTAPRTKGRTPLQTLRDWMKETEQRKRGERVAYKKSEDWEELFIFQC